MLLAPRLVARVRLAVAAGALLACLTGCSGYPDPYTGICPEIDRLRLTGIGPTGLTVSWETDHLTVAFLKLSTPRAPEVVARGEGKKVKHSEVVTGLLPDSPYVLTVVKDLGGVGDLEDLPISCGAEVSVEFRTRPATGAEADPDQVVPDPDDTIVPGEDG